MKWEKKMFKKNGQKEEEQTTQQTNERWFDRPAKYNYFIIFFHLCITVYASHGGSIFDAG